MFFGLVKWSFALKSVHSAPMVVGKRDASKDAIVSTPLTPASRLLQNSSPLPTAVTVPRPVTTIFGFSPMCTTHRSAACLLSVSGCETSAAEAEMEDSSISPSSCGSLFEKLLEK